MEREQVNCDGSGPHANGEVRLFPIGGNGNLILCYYCWQHENKHSKERGEETGQPDNWPQLRWHDGRVYDTSK